jgi:hypothetical protein
LGWVVLKLEALLAAIDRRKERKRMNREIAPRPAAAMQWLAEWCRRHDTDFTTAVADYDDFVERFAGRKHIAMAALLDWCAQHVTPAARRAAFAALGAFFHQADDA